MIRLAALGMMLEKNGQPCSIFKQKGIEYLKQGGIVDALRKIIDEDTGREIEQLFDVDFTISIQIRYSSPATFEKHPDT